MASTPHLPASLWERKLTRRTALAAAGAGITSVAVPGEWYRRHRESESQADTAKRQHYAFYIDGLEESALNDIANAVLAGQKSEGVLPLFEPTQEGRVCPVYIAPYEPALDVLQSNTQKFTLSEPTELSPALSGFALDVFTSEMHKVGLADIDFRITDDPAQARLFLQQVHYIFNENENLLTAGKIWTPTQLTHLPEHEGVVGVIGINAAEKNMQHWMASVESPEAETTGPTWLRLQLVQSLFQCFGVNSDIFKTPANLKALPVSDQTMEWMEARWMEPDGLWKLNDKDERVMDEYTDLDSRNPYADSTTKPLDALLLSKLDARVRRQSVTGIKNGRSL